MFAVHPSVREAAKTRVGCVRPIRGSRIAGHPFEDLGDRLRLLVGRQPSFAENRLGFALCPIEPGLFLRGAGRPPSSLFPVK